MVIEYIRYTIPDAQQAEFEAAYARTAASLRRSTCSSAEFRSFLAEGRSFLAEGRSFIGNIEEMKHYEATTVSSAA